MNAGCLNRAGNDYPRRADTLARRAGALQFDALGPACLHLRRADAGMPDANDVDALLMPDVDSADERPANTRRLHFMARHASRLHARGADRLRPHVRRNGKPLFVQEVCSAKALGAGR